jgi:hypothetical protein
MKTVMYKNDNAIFDFVLPDVIDRLKYYSDQKVRWATELLDAISSCLSPVIKVEADYFGYLVLDLIRAGKGYVYCNVCKEMYNSNQLTSRPLGFGRSPFEGKRKQKGGIFRRFFGRKQLICERGGEGYLCPQGHELIGMITWTGILRIPNVKDITCV